MNFEDNPSYRLEKASISMVVKVLRANGGEEAFRFGPWLGMRWEADDGERTIVRIDRETDEIGSVLVGK